MLVGTVECPSHAPHPPILHPVVRLAVAQEGTSTTYPNLRLDAKRLRAEGVLTFAAFCAKYIRQQ